MILEPNHSKESRESHTFNTTPAHSTTLTSPTHHDAHLFTGTLVRRDCEKLVLKCS